MKRWLLVALILSVAPGGFATVLRSDSFSGTNGTPLVGRSLEQGSGAWSNKYTGGFLGAMTGTFSLTNGGVSANGSDTGASVYTAFDASAQTNGWTLNVTLIPRDNAPADFTMGIAETINKGHWINLGTNDVIRLTYYANTNNAGTFNCTMYDEGVAATSYDDQGRAQGYSVRTGKETVQPTDEIRLSITCYPLLGMIEGKAYNLTGGYELSRQRMAVYTPGLTNMLYAGFGLSGAVSNAASPALFTSFSIETPPDHKTARPLVAPEKFPFSMIFGMTAVTNDLLSAENMAPYQPIQFIHSPDLDNFAALRAAWPDKILTHQDAFGGLGMWKPDLSEVYPGHCLMKAGTRLTADCAATTNDTVLYVEDYTRIATSQTQINSITNSLSSYLILYALDASGHPDWSRAEHVRLVSVNTFSNTVTVKRAQLESSPLAFTNGQAVVAQHMMFWTAPNGGQWQVNFSLECPRGGPFNMTGAEWYALRKKQRIWQTGADGIETDVSRWQWGNPTVSSGFMDCNNDLVIDYGYINGVNSFGLGSQVYLRNLRELLGPNKVIQMDGNDATYGQRGWQYVNGVQMESFPDANRFDRFSVAFLHLRQWVTNVTEPIALSYPFTKTRTFLFGKVKDDDGTTGEWRFRVGFAAALLTGMPHPFNSITDLNFDPANPDALPDISLIRGLFPWDEYNGGTNVNDWQWLGKPLGAAVQVLDQVGSTNLLASTVWQWKTETGFSADCAITNGEYSTTITAIPSNTSPWVKTNYPGSLVPKALWFGTRLEIQSGAPTIATNQDYTLEFEAKGNDSWTVNGQTFEKVPRSLMTDGVADYGPQIPASVFLGTNWTFYRFSMVSDTNTPPPLVFGFSEQVGDAAIRNIHLHQGGAERWMREFEHGRVYLNMTKTPWTVNVGTGAVQRLVGTQIPEVNNGAAENGMLTIPAWDAVFLRTWTVDAWKSAYFTSNQLTNAAVSGDLADPDGDGFSNFQEYTAGTNPQDAQSKFLVGGGVGRTQQVQLNWSSVSGRVYDVYWSTNLLSAFVPLQTNIDQSAYTNPAPSNAVRGFYKIKVRRR